MKPIQLTMSAFGPYKGTEVIDFRELKGNRLFVISGSTGAGKTTIFDGISFALYGNGSGSDRKENKTLRSDFADDKLNTSVELIFEVNQKTYRIMRQLGHVKAGNKTATGEAYEFMEVLADGSETKAVERQRVTDINARVEEIIGLTYDQFNQIIMLPQGEFRKLLTSSSENKEAILRKIFKTDRYGEMARKLEEKKQLAQQQAKRANDLKDSYIEQITGALPPRESALFELLNENANIYQIQQALMNEQLYYQQEIIEQEERYKLAFHDHNVKQKGVIEQQSLNTRILTFQQNQQLLQEKQAMQSVYEAKLVEADTAVKANYLETFNERCISFKKDVNQKASDLEKVLRDLQNAQSSLQRAQETFDTEKAKEQQRQDTAQAITDLLKLKPVYEEIEQQKEAVQQLQQQVTRAANEVTVVTNLLAERKEIIRQKTEIVEEKQQKTLELPILMERQQFLKEATKALLKYTKATKNIALLTDQAAATKQTFEEAQTTYKAEEEKWLSNQAYHFAKQLTPGCECPVCGSTEHPGVTIVATDVVEEAVLKQLKQRRDEAEQQNSTALAQLSVAKEAITDLALQVKELAVEVSEEISLQQELTMLNEQIEALYLQAKQLVTEKEQLKELQQTVQQLEQQKQLAEQTYYQKDNQLAQQKALLEQKQSTIPPELTDLAQLTVTLQQAEWKKQQLQQAWEIAQTTLEKARGMATKLDEAVKYTTQAKEEFEHHLAAAKEAFIKEMKNAGFEHYQAFIQAKRTEQQIALLKQQHLQFTNDLHALKVIVEKEAALLEDKDFVDLTEAEQQLSQLKDTYEGALHNLNRSKEYERNCIDYIDKLEAVAQQIEHLAQISNEIIDIYNIIKGNNAKKVSFERFVQIGYLEQITEAANSHLYNLSNGQYSLTCTERQEAHGRQSGLALDVYDMYTGQNRDVKTLSGGEKFNASLCLALGMADVIQSFQGNIRIDTMFIDEGFGTLDEEALMRAIDILIELQKSGRMIGVISHVAELKAAMPAILHVIKTKAGYSETKIEVK